MQLSNNFLEGLKDIQWSDEDIGEESKQNTSTTSRVPETQPIPTKNSAALEVNTIEVCLRFPIFCCAFLIFSLFCFDLSYLTKKFCIESD